MVRFWPCASLLNDDYQSPIPDCLFTASESLVAENRYKPPPASIHAPVESFGKAAGTLVPVIGSALVELYSHHRNASFLERMNAFYLRLGQAVTDLENWKEELTEREAYKSTLIEAADLSTKTDNEVKLEALKNAVINSALMTSLDEYKRTIFMDLIRRYSPFHLKLLYIFDVPDEVIQSDYVKRYALELDGSHPLELDGTRPFDVPMADLCRETFGFREADVARVSNQLLDMDHLISGDGTIQVRPRKSSLTDFGKEFVDFVIRPKENT
ncbi:MAG: hypothetical protein AAF950_17195 [Pseudomonadota bacterium]